MSAGANSQNLLRRAEQVIPGGVNSPVRAFKNVESTPPFISSGKGARVVDADGNEYLDFVGSWGPLILGHSNSLIQEAVAKALVDGSSFGAPTEREVLFAELLMEVLPPVEMIRLVSSGTEATMSAIRLARGYTRRERIIKCNGCYHGHADFFLVQAGSGVVTHGLSGCAGVPESTVESTISIEFNDLDLMERTLEEIGPETVAAIIVEPVPGNMGLVLPSAGYLSGLRKLCDTHGIVLVFDEVMSGFRVALGGAAERFSVVPDLATYGKVIGGGLPVGAFGGRREIMEKLAPVGPVYQAGTLSGNPLAVAAGTAVVKYLKKESPYQSLEGLAETLTSGLMVAAADYNIPFGASYCGSMFGFFFSEKVVRNFSDAKASDQAIFIRFFNAMLEEGIYLAPSAFEAGFISTAHTSDDIEETIATARTVFARITK